VNAVQRLKGKTACVGGLLLAGLSAAGCGAGSRPTHGQRTAQVVDSAVPVDTALARFRKDLEAPAELTGGAKTLDGLIGRFVTLLELGDTAGLHALTITKEEFAFLYYPTVPESRPPYELGPGLMWFLIDGASWRGLAAALVERGSRPLGYVGYACPEAPRMLGANRLWPLCVVQRVQGPADTLAERLFGPVLERGGRFKFVSLANKVS